VLGHPIRPEVRGPVEDMLLPLALPLLLPPLPALAVLVNSCCGTMPLLADLLPLLLPVLVLLLLERVRRWELLVPMASLICLRDRSDMVLSSVGVEGPTTELVRAAVLPAFSPVAIMHPQQVLTSASENWASNAVKSRTLGRAAASTVEYSIARATTAQMLVAAGERLAAVITRRLSGLT